MIRPNPYRERVAEPKLMIIEKESIKNISDSTILFNERCQYPRARAGKRRRCLLSHPNGWGISPCFPGTCSVMVPW